jgi:hypothetical protein
VSKEWILNSATNRFQLNFKRNVGPTSEEIRKCAPRSIEDWERYYYANVRPRQHLEDLGRKLYTKVTEVIQAEVDSITEQDCIDYVVGLVIRRTFDGYITEKQTIYGQLQDLLGVPIEPAPDEWDRRYNVDFFIRVGKKFIGLQIKPETFEHAPQTASKWRDIYAESQEAFRREYGGRVFTIVSVKDGDRKAIYNTQAIEEIRVEMARLRAEAAG